MSDFNDFQQISTKRTAILATIGKPIWLASHTTKPMRLTSPWDILGCRVADVDGHEEWQDTLVSENENPIVLRIWMALRK